MSGRRRVNGIPVKEGLTEAEYKKAWRAPDTMKAIMDMGKMPDEKWLKMIKGAKVWVTVGYVAFGVFAVSKALVLSLM